MWQVPGSPRIEYSLVVMEELRRAVEEGFQRIGHGGIEIGGVLYGLHTESGVRVMDWRSIPCQHARGPGFVLSAEDEAGLARMLTEEGRDPELKAMEAVGWAHSHNRTSVFLTEEDLEIHRKHFPQPWQIALVMRPYKDKPTTCGFFYREADGGIHAESSRQEFEIFPNPDVAVRERRPKEPPRPRRSHRDEAPAAPAVPAAVEPPAQPAAVERVPVVRAAATAPAIPGWQEPPARAIPWAFLIGVTLVLALAAIAMATHAFWRPLVSPASETLGLEVSETEGQLHIGWDRNASPVREAERGRVQIVDGGHERVIDLDAAEMRRGSLTYARGSEDVQVTLRVTRAGKPDMQEISRFLGPPRPAEPHDQSSAADLEAEAQRLRLELKKESARSQQLRESIRALENRIKAGGKK
jgi:hypothetical protein